MENNIVMYKGRIIKVEKYANQDNELIQGVKRENQSYYDCSGRYAGSNGSYIKFGQYYGMRLDITYSLYDIDKKLIELDNKKFRMPTHVTAEVYKDAMDLLGKKRMPSDVYDVFLSLEGQKKYLIIGFIENTLQVNNGYATVDAFLQIPISIKGQNLIHRQSLYLEEVA